MIFTIGEPMAQFISFLRYLWNIQSMDQLISWKILNIPNSHFEMSLWYATMMMPANQAKYERGEMI